MTFILSIKTKFVNVVTKIQLFIIVSPGSSNSTIVNFLANFVNEIEIVSLN